MPPLRGGLHPSLGPGASLENPPWRAQPTAGVAASPAALSVQHLLKDFHQADSPEEPHEAAPGARALQV